MVGGNAEVLAQPVFGMRPEQLSVAQFIELTNIIYANRVQTK
jgi:hypothetical protein